MDRATALENFKNITGSDDETAQRYLEGFGWNADQALNAFFQGDSPPTPGTFAGGGGAGAGAPAPDDRGNETEAEPQPPQLNNVAQAGEHAGIMGNTYIRALIRLWSRFVAFITFMLGMCFNTAGVPKTRQEIQAVHAATTRKFIDKFQSKYSEPSSDDAGGTAVPVPVLPPFYSGSYRQAIDTARREYKMILVYLHSDRHPNTDEFCRTLCDANLSQYIRDNFVLWGGSIHSEEAYQASSLLHATAFPFLAVILQQPSDRTKYMALYAHEGPISGEELRTNLVRVLEENGAELVVARADQNERDMARALREQQDEEFEEASRADRERMEMREAEQQRQREEEERLQREAQEAEEKETAERERAEREAKARQDHRELQASTLPAEPANTPGQTCTIQFRLPGGGRCTRRFTNMDTLLNVRHFVESLEDIDMDHTNIQLICNFPRRILTDNTSTLEEMDLHKGETIIIESVS